MPKVPAQIWRDLDNAVSAVVYPIAIKAQKNARKRVEPVYFNGELKAGIIANRHGKYNAKTSSNTVQGARFEKNYFGSEIVTPLIQEWARRRYPKDKPIPALGSKMNVNYWSKKYRTGEQNQFMKKSVPTPAQIKSVLDKELSKHIRGGVIYGK